TITGTGGLSKSGGGILTLGPGQGYSGGTTLSGGTLTIADDTALGAAGAGLTFNGGTLRVATGYVNARPVTFAGGGFDVTAGTHDTTGFAATISGPVSGPGTLTKAGAGTLAATGAVNPSAVAVAGGTLQLGAGGSLSAAVSVSSGATLDLNGVGTTLPSL